MQRESEGRESSAKHGSLPEGNNISFGPALAMENEQHVPACPCSCAGLRQGSASKIKQIQLSTSLVEWICVVLRYNSTPPHSGAALLQCFNNKELVKASRGGREQCSSGDSEQRILYNFSRVLGAGVKKDTKAEISLLFLTVLSSKTNSTTKEKGKTKSVPLTEQFLILGLLQTAALILPGKSK